MSTDTMRFKSLVVKEFFGFVNSPLAYMILVPFLLLSHYLFFRTALVLGDANLRPFVELLPWFMVVIGPALAMRSFSDEQRRGTVELLFAHPISEWSMVMAKFLGLVCFYGVMLLVTAVLPLVLILFSDADYGLMFNQYLGALLLGATFLAVGMATSVYIRSQIGSFLVGAAICFGLLLIGMNFVVLGIPAPLNRILVDLGVVTHLNTMARGVLDTRDLLYFATVIGSALTASVFRLSGRKLDERPGEKRKLQLMLILIISIGVAFNALMSSYPIRFDLTQNQRYSLSAGTKNMLKQLPDRVTVTLYTSPSLPGPMQVTLRETGDRLKDFSRYGGERLRSDSEVLDPENTAAIQNARTQGIQEITFNQVGAGSFQAQTGFLGITVRYGDQTEVIPFVQDAGNLEYELSRLILKLTREEQPTLVVIDATNQATSTQSLQSLLSEQYELSLFSEENDSTDWNTVSGFLVIDDGSAQNATAAAQIRQSMTNGINGLFLIDGVTISQQVLMPTTSQSEFLVVTTEAGMGVDTNMVFDLQQNENIQIPSGPVQYVIPYPFWLRAELVQENTPWNGVGNNILLGWPSSLRLSETSIDQVKPLVVTGLSSGAQRDTFTIQPEEIADLKPGGGPYVLGAVSEKDSHRLAVVGDAHIATDTFMENAPENKAFLANLVDWVMADEVLSQIPQRTAGRVLFTFTNTNQVQMVQYVAVITPAVLVTLFGVYWLHRRRQLTKRVYVSSYDAE
jgi:ABC-type uncharacterized transport system involved in gliding motility auxiliary subunit